MIRKAERLGMLADVGKPEWLRIVDQNPKNAPTLGQMADAPTSLLIDPESDETLEALKVRIEDSQRCIAGPGEVPGRLENSPQDGLQV
jgi:hypothetical protein